MGPSSTLARIAMAGNGRQFEPESGILYKDSSKLHGRPTAVALTAIVGFRAFD